MGQKNKNNSVKNVVIAIILIYIVSMVVISYRGENNNYNHNEYRSDTFSIITTPENKVLEETIKEYASSKDIKVTIEYKDNLEIVDALNSGDKYDAIWTSNSIWLDMLDSSVRISNLKSTSITPIVFGVKKKKAEELGLIGKDVTMNDLLNLIKDGKLSFSMANPVMTNSGASAYLNILSTLAGNPEVLKS